jgi:transcription elongation factor Elf1
VDAQKEKTYVQCLNCGHIHIVEQRIPMSVSVVRSWCPRCEWNKALNCGYDDMDVAELKDYYLNERYYY